MLAAPTAPDERLPRVCERARGFVYAVGLLGVTGERDELASSATVIAKRLKAVTDKPVLIGVGISNAEQAVEASEVADGVVIGSALVRRLLDGEGPEGVGRFVPRCAALDEIAGRTPPCPAPTGDRPFLLERRTSTVERMAEEVRRLVGVSAQRPLRGAGRARPRERARAPRATGPADDGIAVGLVR